MDRPTPKPQAGQPDGLLKTMCPMNCFPTLCGMQVRVDGPRAVTLTGDPDNYDSKGFLCMRGRAAHQIVGNPDRLRHPMIRARPGSGDWQQASWDSVLDLIADRMEQAGPARTGLWQSHGNAVNDYGIGLKRGQVDRFANLWGCNVWDPAMICWGLGAFGFGLTGALETSTKEDMGAHSDLIILWGANTVSQAHTLREVEVAKRRGAHVIAIDVRRTEASALADTRLIVAPGSDTALALAMMHVLVAEDLLDRAFIADHTLGFEALCAHLTLYTPDWASAQTGLEPDAIRDLARRYGFAGRRPGRAMIVAGGSSLHKGDNGWQAARAIGCLPALTGQYGLAGGGMGPRHGARAHGAGFTSITALDRRTAPQPVPNQMEAIIQALETGAVSVLLSLGANMLSSFADANRLRRALAWADLVVGYDIFMSNMLRDTAHVALPGTIWLEEIGAKATNTHVYLSDRALPIDGEGRPLYEIYRELGARLGVEDVYPWPDQEAAINEVLDHPATGHVTVADLRAGGGGAALNVSHVAYPTRAFHTPSGKIEFVSQRAADIGLPALPEPPAPPQADAADLPLNLATGRTFAHFHAFYDHGRALPDMATREPEPLLWIAPADAKARMITDGDPVEMVNARGSFTARASVTPRIPAGTLWIRDGWPELNALTDSAAALPDAALGVFPFSVGQSRYGARVELRKIPHGGSL